MSDQFGFYDCDQFNHNNELQSFSVPGTENQSQGQMYDEYPCAGPGLLGLGGLEPTSTFGSGYDTYLDSITNHQSSQLTHSTFGSAENGFPGPNWPPLPPDRLPVSGKSATGPNDYHQETEVSAMTAQELSATELVPSYNVQPQLIPYSVPIAFEPIDNGLRAVPVYVVQQHLGSQAAAEAEENPFTDMFLYVNQHLSHCSTAFQYGIQYFIAIWEIQHA